jgi:MraZ protein
MFLGRFVHALDAKGRVAVPVRFRAGLGQTVVLTRGIDHCLTLYPMETWLPLAEKVTALPIGDPDARAFKRLVFSEAADLELDSQGRILIPPELRRYAGIDREAVIVGVNTSVELWSPAQWDAVNAELDTDAPAFAERLSALI